MVLACQLHGSAGGGLRKGTVACAYCDVSLSQYATGAFQAATLALELRGNESDWVSLCVGYLRGTAWAPEVHSINSISTGFCSQKLRGFIFLALESWTGWPGLGLGLLTPKISLLNFYPRGCGASLRPSYWSGWMWFLQFHCCQTSIQLNFVVVILHST